MVTARHLEEDGLAQLVSYAWLTIVAYTWFGPVLFCRSLGKELGNVELRNL